MNAENNTATTNGMTALDYGGLALSGAGSIASIYSAIQADREAKRRAKLEAEQLQMQKDQQHMAQQQVARQIQTQNALLPSIQNAFMKFCPTRVFTSLHFLINSLSLTFGATSMAKQSALYHKELSSI